jgi:hypothetical protein
LFVHENEEEDGKTGTVNKAYDKKITASKTNHKQKHARSEETVRKERRIPRNATHA